MTTPLLVVLVGVFLLDSYFMHERLHRIEINQKSLRGLFTRALQDNVDTVAEVRAMLESNQSHRQ
jgi:hypothetical protein